MAKTFGKRDDNAVIFYLEIITMPDNFEILQQFVLEQHQSCLPKQAKQVSVWSTSIDSSVVTGSAGVPESTL